MIGGHWHATVEESGWGQTRRLYLGVRQPMGRSLVIAPLLPIIVEPHDEPTDPTLSETRIDREDNLGDVTGFLQAVMDEAWRLGMRPRGFADHANELTAVRYHLEDMRALAKVSAPPLPRSKP